MKNRGIARTVGTVLFAGAIRLLVGATDAAGWRLQLGLAGLGVGLIVAAGWFFAYSFGFRRSNPEFETAALPDGATVILTLKAIPERAGRPDLWEVAVRQMPGDDVAYIDRAAARIRENRSPAGTIEVVYPDDFVGYAEPAEGWHEVIWLQHKTDAHGNVRLEPIASRRFHYDGGGELLRYETDPRRFGSTSR